MSDALITQTPKSLTASATADIKYDATIELEPKTVTVFTDADFDKHTQTFDFTTASDATASVTVDDSSIATASVSGNTVTVTGGSTTGSTMGRILLPSTSNYNSVAMPFVIKNINSLYGQFGIKIDKNNSDPATRVSYLYEAEGMEPAHMDFSNDVFDYGDWKDAWFVRFNRPCMLDTYGAVKYYLNPDNYSYDEDGNVQNDYNNTSSSYNAMAEMPLVWIYRYEDSGYEYEIISPTQIDSNYKAYAHTNASGQIKDAFYYGMYGGSGSSSRIRSLSGQARLFSLTAAQEIAGCQANGSSYGWYTQTWSQHEYIRTLLCLMGKSTHTQAVFGNGRTYSGAQTGIWNNKGAFYGVTTTDKNSPVKVFHIEDFWGGAWNRIAGVISNSNYNIYVKMTPEGSGYQTTSTTGYTLARSDTGNASGYINNMQCNEYGMIPAFSKGVSGSSSTYYCDYTYLNKSCYLHVGNYLGGDNAGGFCFNLGSTPTYTCTNYGCGLSCIP